jgi:ATP-binding cassette subfamily F protein 3
VQSEYFAQDQYKELDQDARMIDDIGRVSPSSRETDVRNLLGCFLFSGEEVFKSIGVLSGGERNRYALLRMLLHPANFLLLDEPTNHLDMRAKDVLLHALSGYTGTVVFVSHDRYFIDKLATRVFEIGGGRVEVYPGNYEDFLWRKQGGAEKLQEQVSVAVRAPQPSNGSHAPSQSPVAEKAKRLNPIKRKQMQERSRELEEEISALEAAIAACESSLQNFVSAEETARLTRELAQNRAELQERIAEWEQIGRELDITA